MLIETETQSQSQFSLILKSVSISIHSQQGIAIDFWVKVGIMHRTMEKQLEIEVVLRRALEAEMAIRSLTTKVQHIREAVAEIEEFKKAYNNIRLDNFFKKEAMAIPVEDLEKEQRMKDVVNALEYILASKIGHYRDKINEELEVVNASVAKLPKEVDLSMLGLFRK